MALSMLKSFWQSVRVRIVNKGVVTISPGEFLNDEMSIKILVSFSHLCSDPKMVIRHEWWGLHVAGVGQDEGADVRENDDWTGAEDKEAPPELPVAI